MGYVLRRSPIWILLAGALLAATAARAVTSTSEAGASANAFAIKIYVQGQGVFGTPEAAAPPDATVPSAAYAYPDDGSIVRVASTTASATATSSDGAATGTATSELNGIQLFGGEISIERLVASAIARATVEEASGTTDQTVVSGGTYLDQPIAISTNGRVQLGDWGYIQTLVDTASGGDPSTQGWRQSMRALDLHIVAEHRGLPAGSEIVIGWADASARSETQTTTVTIPKSGSQQGNSETNKKPTAKKTRKHPDSNSGGVQTIPSGLQPKISRKGHVFPVYGQAWYSDSYGSPRADTGWHHGIDIFAPMGTPVLAVAEGTVFSVGWNNLGGNRLWLRDKDGNEFYYAHLSAYSPLALNGLRVKAGAVLGFVGNSGDAITTPPHLHFEAHPAALLSFGYDGSAVDPYDWLVGLEHLRDVKFPEGTAAWAKQIAAGVSTQQPGAVLLHSTDISALPRLDSRSLATVLSSSSSGKTTLARD
jgi:murein DD-endopeptidase MepM/ murein hydrolase activator NlpD